MSIEESTANAHSILQGIRKGIKFFNTFQSEKSIKVKATAVFLGLEDAEMVSAFCPPSCQSATNVNLP